MAGADEDNRQRNWVSLVQKRSMKFSENTDDINKLSDAVISTLMLFMADFIYGRYKCRN
jgi:hypothetical protein